MDQTGLERVRPLVVSAPFGNYVRPGVATATLGTFTAAARPGRLWRILKTVRYSRRMGAWVNRIGLRNPGIGWLEQAVGSGRRDVSDALVSIHGFDDRDWETLIERSASLRPLGIELNISCPNVGEVTWPGWLFERAVSSGVPVVVKLPPIRFERAAGDALDAGVRAFHCCNTLPVPGGGLSGAPLMPLSVRAIADVRAIAAERGIGRGEMLIVGGGGVRDAEHVNVYSTAGADRVAIGSMLMSPRFARFAWDRRWPAPEIVEIAEAARVAFGGGAPSGVTARSEDAHAPDVASSV